jgi:hypothetical protein
MPVVMEEAVEVLGIFVKDLERQALRAILEKVIHSIRVEILSIWQKYGVSSWGGMHNWEFVLRLAFPAWPLPLRCVRRSQSLRARTR